MTGSFALSIILFLSFSVLIDFVDHLMPQSAATSDIDISSSDGGNSIDSDLVQTLSAMEGVKQVYGRRSSFDVAAGLDGDTTLSSTLDLVSFDDFDLKALQKTVHSVGEATCQRFMVTASMSLQLGIRILPGPWEIPFS